MFDVIEVPMYGEKKVRVIDTSKPEETAERIVEMAVIRRGCETSFFTTAPAGQYQTGDIFQYRNK